MKIVEPNGRTGLYRIFNKAGELIYIGISVSPTTRIAQHRTRQSWGHKIHTWSMEWHDSRTAAEAAEIAAIAAENPKYNVKETPLHSETCAAAALRRHRGGYGYRVIVDDITARIAAGELAEEWTLPTVRDLARQYSVSQSTVERTIPVLEDRGLINGYAGSSRWVAHGARRRARARLNWEARGGWDSGRPLPLDVRRMEPAG